LSGSNDVVFLSTQILRLNFCTEALRMIGRILNYPTDAHSQAFTMAQKTAAYARRIRSAIALAPAALGGSCHRSLSSGARWLQEVALEDTMHVCFGRKSLHSAHAGVAKGAQPQTSSPHLLDIVSVAQLAADADNADVDHNDVRLNLDMKQTAGLRCSLRLGGIVLLKSNDDEAIDVAFRYMAGLLVTQIGDEGSMYLPPFLRYGYCSEAPVLFEGSILKNLLLGAQHSTYCVLPTHEEAWRVAEMCGLEAEFLRAPDTFNVGKGGRNLPISARQCLCLARCILSDPSVLLLHKPLSLLSVETATRVLSTFKMYVDYGGLHGMLSRQKRFHSEAATAYVIGNGTRTVVLTGLSGKMATSFVTRTVELTCKWGNSGPNVEGPAWSPEHRRSLGVLPSVHMSGDQPLNDRPPSGS